MKIRYYGDKEEAEVCKAFLAWQGRFSEVIEDITVLKQTKGHFGVLIEEDGIVLYGGMRDLAANWLYYC